MKYDPNIVTAVYLEAGLPLPEFEHKFHPERKWRWDLAWPQHRVALEVQGGIWLQGRHNRGAALKKEWEKLNAASILGWRVMFCEPKEVCMSETIGLLKAALGL